MCVGANVQYAWTCAFIPGVRPILLHADSGVLHVMRDSYTSQVALIHFMSESYRENL